TDINYVNILIQAQLAGQNACWLQYSRSTNLLLLVADSGSGFVASAPLGTAGALSNSQCTVNASASTVSASGNNLTVSFALTFAAAFSGPKNTYVNVVTNTGLSAGWQAKGVWTVPSAPPVAVSVSP